MAGQADFERRRQIEEIVIAALALTAPLRSAHLER
jgi:hypothetical protein